VTAHLISGALLLGYTVLIYGGMRAAQRAGRLTLHVNALWALLIVGYLLTIGRYLNTMNHPEWSDGLLVFVALCGALPSVHLIRRICPSCRRQLSLKEQVVRQPTRPCAGVGSVVWSCPHCGHHAVRTHTIPKLAETSAEAVAWEPLTPAPAAGFGGSYAAGASGSASWAPSPPESTSGEP